MWPGLSRPFTTARIAADAIKAMPKAGKLAETHRPAIASAQLAEALKSGT
jgi:hypothetical protein